MVISSLWYLLCGYDENPHSSSHPHFFCFSDDNVLEVLPCFSICYPDECFIQIQKGECPYWQ